jgi:hypothetical protein
MKALFDNKALMLTIGFALVGLFGFLDYLTGIDLNFFVFYFIPVIMAAWKIDRSSAIALSILSAIVWGCVDFLSGHHYSSTVYYFWNAGIRLISFIVPAIFVDMVRVLLRQQQKLNTDLNKSLTDIKQLKGFLPICASCKKIRNDKGYWEQIEKYISNHSEAEFTHGICPECAKRLYNL